MGERHEIYRQLRKDLAGINTQRGGNPNRLKGFYAEHINSTYANLERFDKGIGAREKVIDDNGTWDSIVKYESGSSGRPIQDKVGYDYNYYKKIILSNQYNDGILRINPDNPLFSNSEKFNELKELAKEHGIKIEKGSVNEKEAKILATVASVEGKVRSKVGMEQNAPLTAEVYAVHKEFTYAFKSISENADKINEAGLNQATSAACFAAATSIGRNAIAVLKGDENLSQATKDVVTDTTVAAVIGYATGATSKILDVSIGDASLLINGTIQLSKQLIAYVDGDIDEEKLVKNIAVTSVQLAAAYMGRIIGGSIGSIGGPIGIMVGQILGEMITTAVCSDIISAIEFSKEFEKQNRKIILLYRNAEREIKSSQERLKALIQKENTELLEAISVGMDSIVRGIMSGSYDNIESGLATIGGKFGLTLENFQEDKITFDNLFEKSTITIVLN